MLRPLSIRQSWLGCCISIPRLTSSTQSTMRFAEVSNAIHSTAAVCGPPGVEVESNKNVLVYERMNKVDMKHAIREQKHEIRARAIGVRKARLGCDL